MSASTAHCWGIRRRFISDAHPYEKWMVGSGAAALLYEIILQKVFTFILGGSLLSATVTISAYMAGLALGSVLMGRAAASIGSERATLRLYGVIELGIGVLGVSTVVLYHLGRGATDSLWAPLAAMGLAPRILICFFALLPITTLLGGTFPVIARACFLLAPTPDSRSPTTRALYGANLLGASLGVGVGSYLVIPSFGLWGAAAFGFILNVFVALRALWRAASASRSPVQNVDEPKPTAPAVQAAALRRYLVLAFLSGCVLFSLEILWTHLLGAVIGTSVYAFSNMLLSVLVSLCVAAYRTDDRSASLSTLLWIGALRLSLSIALLALASFVFAVVGILDPGFTVREITRLSVAVALIGPVAVTISRIFPRLLDDVSENQSCAAVGLLTAVNTIGCLVGLLVGRFVLISGVGSANSLRLIVGLLVVGSMWFGGGAARSLADNTRKTRRLLLFVAAAAFVLPTWRPSWFLSGRNIYFSLNSEGDFHKMLYTAEDAESGFVTVHETAQKEIELRTNGKFEGNNTEEMIPQLAFGYLPSVLTQKTDAAFLIGLGTGVTLKGLADFPFKRLDLAERSMPIVHAARTYFSEINGNVLADPRVTLLHDDGRNALRLSQQRYDVISIEITSIWFAGAADLYSRDFYKVVKERLAPGGVFQQWLQLHHMRMQDMWVALNTVRAEFSHVALWFSGGQGQIIASQSPISVDWDRLRADRSGHGGLKMNQNALFRSVGSLLLDERGIDEYLAYGRSKIGDALASLMVASDLWPYLEYATPRGNALSLTDRLNVHYLRELINRRTPVPVRGGAAMAQDPLFPVARAYFDQRCDDATRLAADLPFKIAKGLDIFSTCQPWLLVPSTTKR